MATHTEMYSIIVSPGGLFVIACLFLPAVLEVIIPIGEPLGLSYLCAWPTLLWFGIGWAVVHHTFRKPECVQKLTVEDAWTASWYLVNGCFFNSAMDVFAGQFQSWQTMTARYNELEPRYQMVGTYDGVTVQLTSWQEIMIQTPCGLLLFYAIHRGAGWRWPLEIVFNCWSVAGVWYFYGSEVVLGFPYIHNPFSNGSFDIKKALTFDVAYKFWLGFVIFPLLWAMVGVYLTIRASLKMSVLAETAMFHYELGEHYTAVRTVDNEPKKSKRRTPSTKPKSPGNDGDTKSLKATGRSQSKSRSRSRSKKGR